MIHILPFATSDRDEIISVIDRVCAECPWMVTTHFQPTPQWLHALAFPACSDHCLLVAHHHHRPVGWCRLFPSWCGDGTTKVELGIGLLPEYRCRGIGTQMIKMAVFWTETKNVRCIHLTTHIKNAAAIRAFSNCSFYPLNVNGGHLKMVYQGETPNRGV